ncbi:MAG TPA: hypothetical protein VH062_01750 [Polyangiaceae bacterium]|jgi:hypothetical protein|nr:hypothetical protein [Polyangiaceae bacterium]
MKRLSALTALFVLGACSDEGAAFTTRLPDGGNATGGTSMTSTSSGGAVTSAANGGASGASPSSGGAAATGSGRGGAESPDAGVDGSSTARPRAFRLATSGAQLVVTGPDLGLQLTDANVADDADVFDVHQEFYGVPWRELEAGQAPPAEWTARMEALAAAARAAKKPVFLSVTMLDGTRDRLAATTTIDAGQVKTTDDTSDTCYDFHTATDAASKRAAYLRYVALMVDTFAPAYMNVAVEVNLFFEKCAAAAPALRDVANAAYDAVKAKAPSTVVFPSIQIDHLYGYSTDSCANQSARDACFDVNYATLDGLKRDRFAMSSYPYLSGLLDPDALPPDWFTRGAARGGEKPLIAETGWLSTPLVAHARDGTCPSVFDETETTSAAYLSRVLDDADGKGLELVTWWSDRDLLLSSVMTDCPCHLDATWCTVEDIFRGPAQASGTDTQFFGELLMKAFGTMGLRLYDGTPKPMLYSLWERARSRPLSP